MWLKLSLVGSWDHYQATVATMNMFHGSPRADNAVRRTEWEIMEICGGKERKRGEEEGRDEGRREGGWKGVMKGEERDGKGREGMKKKNNGKTKKRKGKIIRYMYVLLYVGNICTCTLHIHVHTYIILVEAITQGYSLFFE